MKLVKVDELNRIATKVRLNVRDIKARIESLIEDLDYLMKKINDKKWEEIYFYLFFFIPLIEGEISRLKLLKAQLEALSRGIYAYKGGKIEWRGI